MDWQKASAKLYLKSKAYTNRAANINALKAEIERKLER